MVLGDKGQNNALISINLFIKEKNVRVMYKLILG